MGDRPILRRYNQERQCYTDRPDNLHVSGGYLSITAWQEVPHDDDDERPLFCEGDDISSAPPRWAWSPVLPGTSQSPTTRIPRRGFTRMYRRRAPRRRGSTVNASE